MNPLQIDFSEKRVVVLGYGLEGRASIDFLTTHYSNPRIIVADSSSSIAIDDHENIEQIVLGEDWLQALEGAEIIIRSPGIPYSRILSSPFFDSHKTIITSITDIFLARHWRKTIGVTGTKGKSTTSSFLHAVLTSLGYNSKLIGNIGTPAISEYDSEPDYFVYELSSYQLQDISVSPHVAVFLNIFPEHLDYHGDFDAYGIAKAQICRYQNSNDICVHSSLIGPAYILGDGKKIQYDQSNFITEGTRLLFKRSKDDQAITVFDLKKSRLRGRGNLRNVQAVYCLSHALDLPVDRIAHALYAFKPLEHRLEEVETISGLTFINDSISTVPQASINAIDAFRGEVKVLVAGGYDRGVDYAELAHEIVNEQIRLVLLFKPSGERLFADIVKAAKCKGAEAPEMIYVSSMDEVVRLCLCKVKDPGFCLLSPASPSFGLFKNFQERGEMFKKCIKTHVV